MLVRHVLAGKSLHLPFGYSHSSKTPSARVSNVSRSKVRVPKAFEAGPQSIRTCHPRLSYRFTLSIALRLLLEPQSRFLLASVVLHTNVLIESTMAVARLRYRSLYKRLVHGHYSGKPQPRKLPRMPANSLSA